MNRIVSLIILAAGIVLIIYGVHASHSLGSDFAKVFTGSPSEKSIWLVIGGVILAAIGGGGVVFGSKAA